MQFVRTVDELRSATALGNGGRPAGLVPTMGALHAGHESLVRASADLDYFTVVTIFVNPTQFAPHEDLDRYPRTFEADLQLCEAAGADLVFAPAAETVYPAGFCTSIEVAGVTDHWEGAIRPGHFAGVATVVLKLFNMAQPDAAFFGAKDFQQQAVIRRMVADLDLPIQIVTCPTVREPDGLAMSSRNRYLSPDERQRATAISKSLFAARERLAAGQVDLEQLRSTMRSTIEAAGLSVDYATICDPVSLVELTAPQPQMILLAAARLGNTRLIDNLPIAWDW